jgi:hypothetical protein
MENQSAMDRFLALLPKQNTEQEYEPLEDDEDEEVRRPVLIRDDDGITKEPFRKFEYVTFFFLGVAMLWAW